MEDVDLVDLLDARNADADFRACFEFGKERLAAGGIEPTFNRPNYVNGLFRKYDRDFEPATLAKQAGPNPSPNPNP